MDNAKYRAERAWAAMLKARTQHLHMPDSDQIACTIRDFESAIDTMPPGMFDPLWHQLTTRGHIPGALMFDPELSPELYKRAFFAHRNVKDAMADGKAEYVYPFDPNRAPEPVDYSDHALVVFAADIGWPDLPVYVMDNRHAATEQPNSIAGDHEVRITHDGKPVVRLSDMYLTQRLTSTGGTATLAVEPPESFTPAQRFDLQFRCGTLTTDRCDLALVLACGGRTIYVPAFYGMLTLLLECCESCYNTTRDTICENMRAAEAAWAGVQ